MKRLLSFTVVLFATVACDVVSTEYRTLSEARNDGLFERGWLPDILPLSTHAIHVANNLDLNTSEGSFRFSSDDFQGFRERLIETSSSSLGQFSGSRSALDRMESEGYPLLQYSASLSTWLFSCAQEQGTCEYVMGYRR